MSRIGNKTIEIPKGVTVTIDGSNLACKGPKGQLELTVYPGVTVAIDGQQLSVTVAEGASKQLRAMHGTTRALIAGHIEGVTKGYEKRLEVQGVGYRAQVQGSKIVLWVGFCHTVDLEIPEGVKVNCPDQTHIVVTGIDKQKVGHVAANIRAARKPEPYKGKGVRFEGERIRMKAGKASKK